MYAIIIDLDSETLTKTYQGSASENPHAAIRKVLIDDFGFVWQHGGLYFGNSSINPVTCVLAVQELAQRFDWFAASAKTIRMLRIDDDTDLMPATTKTRKASTLVRIK